MSMKKEKFVIMYNKNVPLNVINDFFKKLHSTVSTKISVAGNG